MGFFSESRKGSHSLTHKILFTDLVPLKLLEWNLLLQRPKEVTSFRASSGVSKPGADWGTPWPRSQIERFFFRSWGSNFSTWTRKCTKNLFYWYWTPKHSTTVKPAVIRGPLTAAALRCLISKNVPAKGAVKVPVHSSHTGRGPRYPRHNIHHCKEQRLPGCFPHLFSTHTWEEHQKFSILMSSEIFKLL